MKDGTHYRTRAQNFLRENLLIARSDPGNDLDPSLVHRLEPLSLLLGILVWDGADGVAVDVDDLGEEPGRDQRADAVQVGQGVSAAATSRVICRFNSAVSAAMAVTRSRRRRHKVARMLLSSPSRSTEARTRARVVMIGICCW
jgi:hypothetical protein